MRLCSDHHDEVCYDSGYCPVCAVQSDFEDQVAGLQDRIEELTTVEEEKD